MQQPEVVLVLWRPIHQLQSHNAFLEILCVILPGGDTLQALSFHGHAVPRLGGSSAMLLTQLVSLL